MPRTVLSQVAVPSPRLLRFLRSQTEGCITSSQSIWTSRVHWNSSRHVRCLSYRPHHDLKLLPPPRPQPSEQSPPLWNPVLASATDTGSIRNPALAPTLSGTPNSPRNLRHSLGDVNRSPLRRLFSSAAANSFWNIFRSRKATSSYERPLPPLASFLDSTTPGRILKATNEPRIRCTEFDENGNVTLVNGEFKKSELIAKYGLLTRDLRKIDSSLLPHILVRPSAILINLLHLRVLIKHNRVLVFDAYGSTDSYTQSVFMYDLEGKLRQLDTRANGSLPYEFRALEAVLISATNGLESEFEGVREPVERVLRELEEDIDRDKLRYLLIYSKKISTFEQTARLVRDALEELLEADDDLARMYLTEKAKGKEREETDHTEAELLLESYHKVTDEIVQAAENLVSSIRNTEEIVKAILDANRNALMLLELRFSVWTLGLGAGTFLAALYGMNLKNFIEESDLGFWGISGISAAASIFVLIYGLGRLRRVQRVSMWGDHCAPTHGSRHRALGTGGPQDPVLQALREELRAEEKGGLWGLGFRRSAVQTERIKRLTDKLDKAKEQTMNQHPQGPLWAKAAANRQVGGGGKPVVE